MVISSTIFYVTCGILAVLILIPSIRKKFMQGGSNFHWSAVFLAIFIPIGLFTPYVYTVTNCDEYTTEILIFPTSEYKMGNHCYVSNKSDKGLYVQFIVYGTVSNDKINDNVIVTPGTIELIKDHSIDYKFTDAPSSISSKSGGEIKSELSCFLMSELEKMQEEEEEEESESPAPHTPVTAGSEDVAVEGGE